MLAPEHRLRSSALFSTVVKKGARKGSRTVVVHLWTPEPGLDAPLELTGGPRAGLIVSKAVGNAVVRHSVSRKLRAVLATIIDDDATAASPQLQETSFVVVRALPATAKASSKELESDVRRCLSRLSR